MSRRGVERSASIDTLHAAGAVIGGWRFTVLEARSRQSEGVVCTHVLDSRLKVGAVQTATLLEVCVD